MPTCPARKIFPSAKLAADNAGELELTTHCRAVASASAAALTAPLPNSSSPLPASLPPLPASLPPLPASSPPPHTDTDDAADLVQVRGSLKQPSQVLQSSLSLDSVIVLSPTTSDNAPEAAPTAKKTKTLPPSEQAPLLVLTDSSIIDIDDIDDPRDEWLNKNDPTADIKYFFSPVPRIPGQNKRRMKCNVCA